METRKSAFVNATLSVRLFRLRHCLQHCAIAKYSCNRWPNLLYWSPVGPMTNLFNGRKQQHHTLYGHSQPSYMSPRKASHAANLLTFPSTESLQ